MIKVKISGATPKSGKSICTTCKHATVVRGQNCEEMIGCGQGIFDHCGGIVRFKVAECGSYHPVNVPWLHEMEAMAWKIEARKKGAAGFSDPERMEGDEQMEVVITKPKNKYIPELD